MKLLMNVSLAAVLAMSSVISVSAPASARVKHHDNATDQCVTDSEKVGGVLVLGLLLGAVTGGVGSALAYGAAYAVGGAAIGGAGGAVIGVVAHDHDRGC